MALASGAEMGDRRLANGGHSLGDLSSATSEAALCKKGENSEAKGLAASRTGRIALTK